MRFDELPDDWTHLPLHDAPLAAGVIDLVTAHADRVRNSLLVLPCDHDGMALPAPVLVSDVDWSEPDADRRRGLEFLAMLPAPGAVVAVSARRRPPPRLIRGWLRTTEDVLEASGRTLVAFGAADLDGVEIIGGLAGRDRGGYGDHRRAG